MNPLILFLLIVFSVMFHGTVVPQISQKLIFSDLPALLTIVTGIVYGPFAGMLTGFTAGLLSDLSFGTVVGTGALAFTVTGYVSGILEQNIQANSRFTLSLFIAMLTIFKHIFASLFTFLAGLDPHFMASVVVSLCPAVTNGLLFFLIFKSFVFVIPDKANVL